MKDTYYFSHDFNAHNDPKILKMLFKNGWEYYGLYWAVVEKLAQETGTFKLSRDYETLAYFLHVDEQKVRSLVEDFDLFETDESHFWSKRLIEHFKIRENKSNNAKDAARSRWGDKEERTKAENVIFYVLEIYNESEKFIKVGITTESVARRYSGKMNGYKFNLLFQKDVDFDAAILCEKSCEKFAKYTPKNKFAGSLECYEYSEKSSIIDFAMRTLEFRNAIKERKGKEKKEKEKKEKPTADAVRLARLFFDSVRKNQPTFEAKIETDAQIQNFIEGKNWAGAIDDCIRLDGRTSEQLELLTVFIHGGEWRGQKISPHSGSNGFTWSKNFMSPAKFRKKDHEGVSYFDKISAELRRCGKQVDQNSDGSFSF